MKSNGMKTKSLKQQQFAVTFRQVDLLPLLVNPPLYDTWQKTTRGCRDQPSTVRQKRTAHGRISISCQFVNSSAIIFERLKFLAALLKPLAFNDYLKIDFVCCFRMPINTFYGILSIQWRFKAIVIGNYYALDCN